MLLTKLLPPQFLLPAWSVAQLASVLQRAHASSLADPPRAVRFKAADAGSPQKPSRSFHATTTNTKWGYDRLATFRTRLPRTGDDSTEGHQGLKRPEELDTATEIQSQEEISGIKDDSPVSRQKTATSYKSVSENGSERYSALPSRSIKLAKASGSGSIQRGPSWERENVTNDVEHIPSSRSVLADLPPLSPPISTQSIGEKQHSPLEFRTKPAPFLSTRVHFSQSQSELGAVSSPRPAKHKTKDKKAKQQVSLFEELFPELNPQGSMKEREALINLERLPAFEWTPGSSEPLNNEAQRNLLETSNDHTTVKHNVAVTRSQIPPKYEPLDQEEPSLLVLNGSSTTLEESDFFRQGPKGEHLEGWTSGIIKVIPSRDLDNLRFKGGYFILFSSDAAARAYLDQTVRLHRLSRYRGTDKEAFLPPPPGYLQEDEDIDAVLQGFTLVPGHSKLALRLIKRPYHPAMQQTLQFGGPVATVARRCRTEHLVMFYVDIGYISVWDLRQLVKDDGHRRNLPWKLAGSYTNIYSPKGKTERSDDDRTRKKSSTPTRYIVPFIDQQEARRFVRDWHRREFALKRGHEREDELSLIANAELIW